MTETFADEILEAVKNGAGTGKNCLCSGWTVDELFELAALCEEKRYFEQAAKLFSLAEERKRRCE